MYRICTNIIPRNIDGIYFAINRNEYRYYTDFKLIAVNVIGYTVLSYLKERTWCSLEEISNYVYSLIKSPKPSNDIIKTDIKNFLNQMHELGYINEK